MKEKNSVSRNKVEMVESQDSSGKVVECLKQNFLKHIITNEVCKQVLASPQGVTVELELIIKRGDQCLTITIKAC